MGTRTVAKATNGAASTICPVCTSVVVHDLNPSWYYAKRLHRLRPELAEFDAKGRWAVDTFRMRASRSLARPWCCCDDTYHMR